MDSEEGEIFCQDDFMSQSFSAFEDMRRKEQLVDFKISFKDRSFIGHRLVLAARIPHYREIFCGSQQEVTLNEVDSDALESVINFAYSGKIKITQGNVASLLSASKALQLTRVYDACWEFLKRKFNPSNVLEGRRLAEDFGCSKFLQAADNYIKENFDEFTSSESFLTIPFLQLKEIISGDDVKVSTEGNVFEAVITWVKAVPSERKDFLPDLLSSVRMCYMTPNYLIERVCTEEFVRSSLRCRDLVDEAKNYHLSPAKRLKFLPSQPRLYDEKSLDSRLPSQPGHNNMHHLSSGDDPRRILIYSVYCRAFDTITVELFHNKNKTWMNLSTFRKFGEMDAVVLLEGVIYIFVQLCVVTFNIQTHKWNTLNYTHEVLASGNVSHNGRIYFIGGYGEESAEVRSFDPSKQNVSWESRMPKPLRYPGVTLISSSEEAPLQKSIFITGGACHGNIYDTVERYDLYTKQWTQVSPMFAGRCRHGCCELNKKIYVCGGITRSSRVLNSVEAYDPFTDQWNIISLMVRPEIVSSAISNEEGESIVFTTEYGIEIFHPKSSKRSKTHAGLKGAFRNPPIFVLKSVVPSETYDRILNETCKGNVSSQ